MRDWVRFPTRWIIYGNGLTKFRWDRGKGSDNIAALMALAVIAHHAADETGEASLTYEQLCAATNLSRAKIAGGLKVLEERQVIQRNANGRSTIRLLDYNKGGGWAKLPANGLYSGNRIDAFNDFHLRRPSELNALKLYFLIVAMRDRNTNLASISHERMSDYTGIDRNRIKAGLTVLAVNGLVYSECFTSPDGYPFLRYRLAHLDSRTHMGMSGRKNR